ncbi:protein-disulfide reductase DsbD [Entomomonas asaccharolytica]|uniref:Thiol:disulfide interchange protein DsbD n=1 Tax=Entomomonas asaccharolytica TaxID=2785331 RepID=A0A974NDP6_9GAMM|nr:protein-disulfide reductase DsbD [Entomomonas asaccharolytica]QQP84885.1 protein-disulfide reductase DsbD [Entomomonas asaccharolytica]
MKRLVILLLSLIVIVPALANNDILQARPDSVFGGSGVATDSQDSFLAVEQAFRIEKKQIDAQSIHLQFIIADGYYLYKERFSFASDNPKVTIASFTLPKGQIIEDEFFGQVEVYHAVLDLVIPVTNPDKFAFNFEIKYQGCAEKGLCYPMETATIPVAGVIPVASQPIENSSSLSFSDSWAALSWLTLLSYFGFGLLLSLTPCVFPMLPILAGVVLRGQVGTLRAQLLALTYILSMAITYAIFGVLLGLFGAELNIAARLQSPWVLIPFAIFFVLFALAMFGLFELRLPAFITNPLNKAADKTHGGSLLGAAILGVCSSLVVSPCVSAPFAGILLHISTTGDAVGGGIGLFALGLGMGLPLFIIAAGGKALLPKTGMWMVVVRNAIGVMLLAVAIYLLSRIIAGYITLALWGLLAAGVAIFIGTFDFSSPKTTIQKLAQVVGLFLIVYAICAWVGAWQGNDDPLQSLKRIATSEQSISKNTRLNWQVVYNQEELDKQLAIAKAADKIVMVDWSADWCIACLKMEKEVFEDDAVATKLADYQLIKIDMSKMTDQHRQLQNNYKVFGPPTILFFDRVGNELINARIVGEMGQAEFLAHLDRINP